MTMNRKVVLLWCLAGGFIVTNAVSPSPTNNPECPGMKRAASHLETGVGKFTNEPVKCKVNKICTGLSCNGTHQSNPFYMKVILHHCMKPAPEIHLDLKYPAKGIVIHKELKQGSTVTLYSAKLNLGSLDTNLKLTLARDKNRITSSIVLETCTNVKVTGSHKCKTMLTLLPKSTFCVNMNTCPGFNTTGYPPCHVVPVTPKSSPTKSTPTEPLGGDKGHQHGGGHHGMSVRVAVGIGFACIAVIGIIVGVIVYWKKYHHRARLRAAYYNDISMNDPLYEDFGPEVA